MDMVNKETARVLVVDDEPNITELLSMALRYEGFTVKTAATGRAALTAVTQFSPALVILDVMLPDIDGLEVLKRLNAGGQKVPIIFLTAKDATEDKVHGLTIGGDDYVTKPFSIEELMARVRVVLRRHGSDSETGKLSLADLELDDEAHEVRRHGHVIELTNTTKMTLSLRGRLLIGVISLVVIGLLVANVATYLSLQKFLVGRVDDQLRSGVAEVSTELGAPGPSSNRSTAFPPGTVAELLGTDGSVVKTKVAESGFGTTTSAVTPVLPTALPSKGLDTP